MKKKRLKVKKRHKILKKSQKNEKKNTKNENFVLTRLSPKNNVYFIRFSMEISFKLLVFYGSVVGKTFSDF